MKPLDTFVQPVVDPDKRVLRPAFQKTVGIDLDASLFVQGRLIRV